MLQLVALIKTYENSNCMLPDFGGVGSSHRIGLALSERGHEVHFITYKQPVRLEIYKYSLHFHGQYPTIPYFIINPMS